LIAGALGPDKFPSRKDIGANLLLLDAFVPQGRKRTSVLIRERRLAHQAACCLLCQDRWV